MNATALSAPGTGQQLSPLMVSALCGCCVEPMKVLLAAGSDPYYQPPSERKTAIHIAASHGTAAKCELLLTSTARLSPDIRDSEGSTPLMNAARAGNLAAVQLLHRLGADLDATNTKGMTAVGMAAFNGKEDVLSYLLDSGVSIGEAAHMAASSGSIQAVRIVQAHGGDMQRVNHLCMNMLFPAVCSGNVRLVEMLVAEHGLDLAATNGEGQTLLMEAAIAGLIPMAKYLLSKGLPLNATNMAGCTALDMACASEDNPDMVKLLLRKGASSQHNALHRAVELGRNQSAAVLLQQGRADPAHPSTLAKYGATCLHVAVHQQNVPLIKLLLAHGAAVTIDAPYQGTLVPVGATALMLAQTAEIVKLLLSAGASARCRTCSGHTCLQVAAMQGCPIPVICLLIKAGCDIKAKTAFGDTAAMLARVAGHNNIAALLDRAAESSKQ